MTGNMTTGVHLAMWCGPRNISTALMRAWENRPETFVVDEPLYAHYLRETKLPHAMADEIIEHYEADWEKVTAWLTGPIPGGNTIFYQKHMCHHMLPSVGRDWLGQVKNCFLIREPSAMLTSLIKNLPATCDRFCRSAARSERYAQCALRTAWLALHRRHARVATGNP